MRFLLKLVLTNLVIIGCAIIGRRSPSLGGLLATMPLTTLAVLLWLEADNPGNRQLLSEFTGGVLWGIGPTVLFFGVLYPCLRRGVPLSWSIALAGAAWLGGAALHQTLVR